MDSDEDRKPDNATSGCRSCSSYYNRSRLMYGINRKDLNTIMIKEAIRLATDKFGDDSGEAHFWALENSSDEDATLTVYRPKTLHDKPCFPMAYTKIKNYFAKNKTGRKPIPPGMKFGKANTHLFDASGTWMCFKLYRE